MDKELLSTVVSYSYAVFPWLILGIIIAYFLEKKISRKMIADYFSKVSLRRLFVVQIFGMISPLSIMSFLPVASELEGMGFNPGILLSFLVAERAYDLQSLFIISGLFGIKYALLNGIAIFASLMLTALLVRKEFVHFKVKDRTVSEKFWLRQSKLLLLVFVGILVGAVLRNTIPEGLFQIYAAGNLQGLLLAIILGLLLYFGPIVGNYPVAKAFSDLGMSQMGTFAFLTVSPVFNLVVMVLLGATVGFKNALKVVCIYGLLASFITIGISYLLWIY